MTKIVAIALTFVAVSLAAEPAPERGPLRLTLKRAVELALSPEGSASIQLARELTRQARDRSAEARSALLPNLDGSIGEQNQVRNLQTMGLKEIHLPFGLELPSQVGPYNVFDVRATAVQNVFDLSSIRRLQAAHKFVKASKAEEQNVDDQVCAQVAKAYLEALRGDAEMEAAQADVSLAEAVLQLAENQKNAGVGTRIEVTRARVQLANDKQRRLVAEYGQRKARMQLLRVMGMRLDTDVDLADTLTFIPTDAASLDQAKADARDHRWDLKAQQQREETARLNSSATKMEQLPSVVAFADYGSTGPGYYQALPTRTYGFGMRVPVFDGFRRSARIDESRSVYRQEKVRTNDLKDQMDLEVELAYESLRSAAEQVAVATEGLGLAEGELTQARRRYESGVASPLEVTDAQTRLARARQNRIAALYGHNLARFELGQATGTIRRLLD
jgi:outer membrane protein